MTIYSCLLAGWFRVLLTPMKKYLALIIFLSLPALAQETPLGTRIRKPTAVAPADLRGMNQALAARTVMDQFGRCIVASRPRVTELVVTSSPLGPDLWKSLEKYDLAECLTTAGMSTVTLTMSSPALRGAVFKALYTRDHGNRAPAMPGPGADGSPPPQPDWLADVTGAGRAPPDDPQVQTYVALRRLSACVVLNRAEAVHRLMLSRPGSAAETATFGEIMPAVSGCIPDGQQLSLSKLVLIGTMAEVAQRMALPAAAPPLP